MLLIRRVDCVFFLLRVYRRMQISTPHTHCYCTLASKNLYKYVCVSASSKSYTIYICMFVNYKPTRLLKLQSQWSWKCADGSISHTHAYKYILVWNVDRRAVNVVWTCLVGVTGNVYIIKLASAEQFVAICVACVGVFNFVVVYGCVHKAVCLFKLC